MSTADSTTGPQWFGHPRGLSTLFMTEMWERLSYYGMRALLVLFMTDSVRGGFGMEASEASAAYGLYTFGAYALALPGGWIADRLIGKKKSVLYGGIIIALGHYCLFVHNPTTFFVGLFLVVLGTGLLKPNVSAIVGDLYPEGGARRDAGFSTFYSGINLGAFLGQTVCPILGEKYDWHLGFGFAALGMTLGVIQYVLGQKHLEGAGDLSPTAEATRAGALRVFWIGLAGFVGILAVSIWILATGQFGLDLVSFVSYTGVIVVVLSAAYFAYSIIFSCNDNDERKRVGVIALLFLGAAVFWSGFEQSGSSMTLFARDFTDRVIFGWEVPAGMLQNVNALMIIIFAPVVGALWLRLGSRNPSIPVKFALGLMLLGAGFLVMVWASLGLEDGGQAGMRWLVATYFFHTIGELCLSPVGLSSITKLSPEHLVGQMMGTWFMGSALGNLIAGLVGGLIESLELPRLFGSVAAIPIGVGVLFLLLAPLVNRMTGKVN